MRSENVVASSNKKELPVSFGDAAWGGTVALAMGYTFQ